jgi:tripartite ATP-independent transporter DctM subunit
MCLGTPIGFSLIISSIFYIFCFSNLSAIVIVKQMLSGVDSFALLALPFFLLLGELLTRAKLTTKLINIAGALVGHMKGSLAQINIVSSMLLAGVQGAASSDTAAIGGMLIPAMKEDGYSPSYSAAVTAISSAVGPIIPPSLTMVIYGSVAGASIGRLFMAGAVPGVMLGLFLMVYCGIRARKGPEYCGTFQPFSFKRLLISIKEGWPAIFVPIIIIAGIALGVFTPTESGVFACLVTLILGLVVYRTLGWKEIVGSAKATVGTLSNILIIVSGAAAFGWILTREGAVEIISGFLFALSKNPIVIMLIINAILLIAGCFVETLALVLLFTPIFLPIVTALGYSPIHFGVIMVLNLTLGTVTPPLGVCMYLSCDLAKIKVESFMKEALPMYIPVLICLMIVILIPQISMFLPNLLMPVN